ncbi:hypothetical protein UFOVP43_44 [uncultured Caudovirales phage]|uniref:Uncharacterized protein n=1 Tax=uncultured Caudovirales phage TaxID=2100421 RepID=A0A6J5KR25_9CAUD|nr:hypothetical protein UFOVP43_44 [uncultured Caudovirales phage]
MLKRKIQWVIWRIGKMLEKKDPKKRPRLYKQATVVTKEANASKKVHKP